MSYLEILLLALALAVDAFTVGASVGLQHRTGRQVFRLSFHFGLFQGIFLILGALFGSLLINIARDWSHWIAFSILSLIGIRMIYNAHQNRKQKVRAIDLTKGMKLVGLSIAVSIDALAAGVGLTGLEAPIYTSGLIVGVIATIATASAMIIADRTAILVDKYAEVIAGLVLIGLGVKILNDHIDLFRLL